MTDVPSIPWRTLRVWRDGREVQAPTRLRVLRLFRDNGKLPDGYTLEPSSWKVIDFMGFDEESE